MKGKRVIMGLGITFCVVMLIWFGGWAVWTQFDIWVTMTNTEYQTSLFVLMALAVLVAGGLTMRKRKVPVERQRLDSMKPVKKEAQNPVDLGPINERLDELAEKVADIHSMMNFMKKVKEKNGEKP